MKKSRKQYGNEYEKAYELARQLFERTETYRRLSEDPVGEEKTSRPDDFITTIQEIMRGGDRDYAEIYFKPLMAFMMSAVEYYAHHIEGSPGDFFQLYEFSNSIYRENLLLFALMMKGIERGDTDVVGFKDELDSALIKTLETGEFVVKIDITKQNKGRILWELGEMIDMIEKLREEYKKMGGKVSEKEIASTDTANLDYLQCCLMAWDLNKSGKKDKEIVKEIEAEIINRNIENKVKAVRNWYKDAQKIIDAFDRK